MKMLVGSIAQSEKFLIHRAIMILRKLGSILKTKPITLYNQEGGKEARCNVIYQRYLNFLKLKKEAEDILLHV